MKHRVAHALARRGELQLAESGPWANAHGSTLSSASAKQRFPTLVTDRPGPLALKRAPRPL